MKQLTNPTHLVKGVIIGAGSAGMISLIPLVNLLNLFFMFWMALGGAIGVHVFQRNHRRATHAEASLCGGLSGLLGGIIFAGFTYLALQFVDPESFERLILLIQKFMPPLQDEINVILDAGNFHTMIGTVLVISIGVSSLVGILGGLISRWIYKPSPKGQNEEALHE